MRRIRVRSVAVVLGLGMTCGGSWGQAVPVKTDQGKMAVPLDDQNLLYDWNDRGVAILPHLRHRIDPPAYRNRLDLDALARQVLGD